jgi:hypothetical protein
VVSPEYAAGHAVKVTDHVCVPSRAIPVSTKLSPDTIWKFAVIVPGPFRVAVVLADALAAKVIPGADAVQVVNEYPAIGVAAMLIGEIPLAIEVADSHTLVPVGLTTPVPAGATANDIRYWCV